MANSGNYNPYNPFDLREGRPDPPPAPPPQAPPMAAADGIVFDLFPERGPGFFRRRHNHHHVPPILPFPGHWPDDSDSAYDDDSYYTSGDEDAFGLYPYPHPFHNHNHHHRGRRRNRHRHIHLPAGLPLPLNNIVVRRPSAAAVAAAAPRNYGYRRLHYQGGQERRGQRRTGTHNCTPPCAGHHGGGHCGRATAAAPPPEAQRNILVRCRKWLFGESGRCMCGPSGRGGGGACAGGTEGCCRRDGERSRSRSPTRHREEEYWGPGTQDWAYGPPGNRSTNWRDTPWSSGANSGLPTMHNLAPGAVLEEVEEGGTLPAFAAAAASGDRAHNHYHIGTDGRERRHRGGSRNEDKAVLSLVDRERDREMQRQLQAGDRDWAERRDWNMREHSEREAAWKRDMRLLTLLDRERERDSRGTRKVTGLLGQELHRSRIVNPNFTSPTRRKGTKKLEASDEPDSKKDEGLKSELEALRKDFDRLLKSSSKPSSLVGEKEARRAMSTGGSAVARGRQKSAPAPPAPATATEIDFDHGRASEDETEESGSDEDELDGQADEEDDHDSAS